MILRFLSLLNIELCSDDTSGRLMAHLSSLQETLFKWSNTQTLSLWSALGFSKPSSFPAKLRLIFRYLATIIASRLLKAENQAERLKLEESFESFSKNNEYLEFSKYVIDMKTSVNLGQSLVDVYQSAYLTCNSLFPEIISLICPDIYAST